MNVCAGCTHEYDETFKFCPECGHRFGAAAENQADALNQGLRRLAASAVQESRLEQSLRSESAFNRPNEFESLPSSKAAALGVMEDMNLA